VNGAIVLDIEGTTGSTEFVFRTLFPYARERFTAYLTEHAGEPRVQRLVDDVRAEIGEPDAHTARIVAALEDWTDRDVKATPLKTVQGWIWDEGFARGDLTSHFFPDVIPALRRWHADGGTLAVFSSGSVDAQRAWYAHTPAGDLTDLISAHFDTANAGPKKEPDSYRKIAAALARPPDDITFLSDVQAELDAARAAGWRTIGVRRPGEPAAAAGIGTHREVASFDAVSFSDRDG
jgi:enolase-phosphatase E1